MDPDLGCRLISLEASLAPARGNPADATRGADPMLAGMRLGEHEHLIVRQSLVDTVADEAAAVEAREALRRADPQESARICGDAENPIGRQAIGRAVALDGK